MMRNLWQVARQEILHHLRTKRLLIIASIFVVVLLLLTLVVPVALFSFEESALLAGSGALENQVLLFFLSGFLFIGGYFYIQLLPLVLTADAVCSEWSRRSVFLLLSKPVSRDVFVLGKFLGSFLTVAGLVVGLLVLDYLILQPILPGNPTGSEVAAFLGALGIIVLGVAAFAALAMFFSTITRSTVAAMILAVAAWIIVLPLLGNLDLFVALAVHGPEAVFGGEDVGLGWSDYLSPSAMMETASAVLAGSQESLLFGSFGTTRAGWAVVALLVHTGLFLGLSLLVVRRRSFE